MKTINIEDELHNRLKIAAEYCGISMQNLVKEMLERDFSNTISVKEFIIEDINDIDFYREQMESYLKFKNLKEGEFKVTLTSEIFKNPVIKIYYK